MRYLEIVELKDLNLRIIENVINKMKREDSICVPYTDMSSMQG
jgi:hypothetical protein